MKLTNLYALRVANIPMESKEYSPLFFEQIKWVSDSLTYMVKEKKKNNKIEYSLQKYFNRAKYRATPLGLFSSILLLDEQVPLASSLIISEELELIVQPTSEWLNKLMYFYKVKYYDKVLLNVKKNTIKNKFSNYILEIENQKNSFIENNIPMSLIFDVLKTPKTLHEVDVNLKQQGYNFPYSFLKKMILNLLDKNFIQTEFDQFKLLDPRYFLESSYLSSLIGNRDKEILEDLKKRLYNYKRTQHYEDIKIIADKMKKILPLDTDNYLEIFSTREIIKSKPIEKELLDNLEDFSEFLIKYSECCNENQRYTSDVNFFKDFFENTRVPFKKFYDIYISQSVKNKIVIPKSIIDNFILENIDVSLIFSHNQVVNIEKILLNNKKIENKTAYPTMQLSIIPYKDNEQLKMRVSPLEGAFGLGNYDNRFAVINFDYMDRLINLETSVFDKQFIQLYYLNYYPNQSKYYSILPAVYSKNTINIDMSEEKGFDLEDLYIQVNNNKFQLINKNNQICCFKNMNMGNLSMLATNLVQDLIFWSKNYYLNNFSLFQDIQQFKNEYGFVPEIVYKGIVVCPQTVKLSFLFKKDNFTRNIEKLKKLRKDFPNNHLYIRKNDHGFLLQEQEDMKLNVQLIEECLKKSDQYVLEITSGYNNSITEDLVGKSYFSEYILNFYVEKNNKLSREVSKPLNMIKEQESNNWIQINFFIPKEFQTIFIGTYLKELDNLIDKEYNVKQFFFIRYFDQRHFIRIRFKTNDFNKLSEIINKLNIKHNIASKEVEIGQYRPEIYRYGQGSLKILDAAEQLFSIESSLVIKNNYIKDSNYSFQIYFIMVVLLFKSYKPDLDSLVLSLKGKISNREYSKNFREDRIKYSNLFNKYYFQHVDELDVYMYEWINSFEHYLELLEYFQISDIEQKVFSVIHMLGNRLFGIDRDFEQKCSNYIYRIGYSELGRRKIISNKD